MARWKLITAAAGTATAASALAVVIALFLATDTPTPAGPPAATPPAQPVRMPQAGYFGLTARGGLCDTGFQGSQNIATLCARTFDGLANNGFKVDSGMEIVRLYHDLGQQGAFVCIGRGETKTEAEDPDLIYNNDGAGPGEQDSGYGEPVWRNAGSFEWASNCAK
ncbi:hypothetical protein [Winogradskya humida]|uniref:Uncharacterized protein n=1 Tax=Winogradskya humida TaxID=113566 RepID=A0ABQ4A2T8_9ACTN|nr:hypothetical protein [Actinoplanes humidus]GIE24938.1 hypothetical protein Ahu01nite_080400 [Actinoplanes humidus]